MQVNDPEVMNGFLDLLFSLLSLLILLQNKLTTLSSTSKPNRLLHSLLHFLLLLLPLQAKNTSFDSSFSFSNLTFLGDGSIAIVCNLPIQFYDLVTNISASFSTKFSFIPNPQSSGDGLTFFISPDNRTIGSTGGYLGLFNSSGGIKNGSVVAVEFDTRLDGEFDDTSDKHVGLEIETTISMQSVDIGVYGIVLKSGTAWIEYHNNEKKLEIWLGHSNIKPPNPIFSTKIDLSEHFQEFMYVGFSASTEGSTELHMVKDWSFQTFAYPSPSPTSNFSNSYVSDTPPSMIPEIHRNSSGENIVVLFVIFVFVFVPFVLVLVLVYCNWKCIKERVFRLLRLDVDQSQ